MRPSTEGCDRFRFGLAVEIIPPLPGRATRLAACFNAVRTVEGSRRRADLEEVSTEAEEAGEGAEGIGEAVAAAEGA